MKKIMTMLTSLIVMMFLGSFALAKDWDKIRIGVEGAYPPFSYITASGELEGFDIEIARALCDEMGAECTLVQQDWDGIIPALLARKYDAIIASMSITEERKKKVAFTNKYYQTPAKFAQPKGAGNEITPEGLKGKTVGVQRATTHDNFVTSMFGDAVDVRRYGTQDEAYLDAVAGRLDLLLADSMAMAEGFINAPDGAGWEFVGPGFTDVNFFGEGAGIAIRKKDMDLVEKFNAAISAIRANGKYQEINNKYFEFDVYGE